MSTWVRSAMCRRASARVRPACSSSETIANSLEIRGCDSEVSLPTRTNAPSRPRPELDAHHHQVEGVGKLVFDLGLAGVGAVVEDAARQR